MTAASRIDAAQLSRAVVATDLVRRNLTAARILRDSGFNRRAGQRMADARRLARQANAVALEGAL